jgi:hypothetical protein
LNARSLGRRQALAALLAFFAPLSRVAAFGQAGAFNPRILTVRGHGLGGVRRSALARWAWEVARRTSASARLVSSEVSAADAALLGEPFVVWAGSGDVPDLSLAEVARLRQFLLLGGLVFVDDGDPESGAFGRAARRELTRVLPECPVIKLDAGHVLYRTYYILARPVGRVLGPPSFEAMLRGSIAQVIFSSHDLLGALARPAGGDWALQVVPGGSRQREQAVRLATNLAMYLLCSDYKDDAVHAPELMRRRARHRS